MLRSRKRRLRAVRAVRFGRTAGPMTVVAACTAGALAACGDTKDAARSLSESPSAGAGPATRPLAPSLPDGDTALAAARAKQLARGELLSFSCRPCHGLAPGDESPVGPPLYGMFGRPAGRVEGFEYSAALRESGIVWTPETLDAWLAQPEAFLPGNDMEFAGFKSAEDRAALIAYLRERTAVEPASPPQSPPSTSASD